jgi:hypothetical protein
MGYPKFSQLFYLKWHIREKEELANRDPRAGSSSLSNCLFLAFELPVPPLRAASSFFFSYFVHLSKKNGYLCKQN